MQSTAMTQEEYESHKKRLEEQLQAGFEILKSAYDHQVRALEVVWMITQAKTAAAPRSSGMDLQAAPAPLPTVHRRRPWELMEDVENVLPNLPEVFDRNHVCKALGYKPDRGSLHRTLQEMVSGEVLTLEAPGSGKTPSRYRKTG